MVPLVDRVVELDQQVTALYPAVMRRPVPGTAGPAEPQVAEPLALADLLVYEPWRADRSTNPGRRRIDRTRSEWKNFGLYVLRRGEQTWRPSR